VVPRVQPARGSRFLVLVASLLVSGLIGLLLLNLSMQKGAFELAGIQAQSEDLRTQEQALSFDMQRLGSTQHLSRRATKLGMLRNNNPVFLDLTDGSIIGDPVPAQPAVVAPDPVSPPPVEEVEDDADTPAGQPEGAAREGAAGGSQGEAGRR
jgi:hypothetical protein